MGKIFKCFSLLVMIFCSSAFGQFRDAEIECSKAIGDLQKDIVEIEKISLEDDFSIEEVKFQFFKESGLIQLDKKIIGCIGESFYNDDVKYWYEPIHLRLTAIEEQFQWVEDNGASKWDRNFIRDRVSELIPLIEKVLLFNES